MIWKLYEGLEDEFQKSMATFLDAHNLNWTHPANERDLDTFIKKNGTSFSPMGQKLKAKGVKSGVSDCLIFKPSGDYHGFHLELKAKARKMTQDQYDFLQRSRLDGYYTYCTWSLDEAMHKVKQYLNAYPSAQPIKEDFTAYVNQKGTHFRKEGLGLKALTKKELEELL